MITTLLWVLIGILGVSLIGGLVAFATRGSKGSKSDTDFDKLKTDEQEQSRNVSVEPSKTFYLNTMPNKGLAQVPQQSMPNMGPAPVPQQPMPVPQQKLYPLPGEQKPINNSTDNNSLQNINSLFTQQQKFNLLQQENQTMQKENDDIFNAWNNDSQQFGEEQFINELTKQHFSDPNSVDNDVRQLVEKLKRIKTLSTIDQPQRDTFINALTGNLTGNFTNHIYLTDNGNPTPNFIGSVDRDNFTQTVTPTKNWAILDNLKIIVSSESSLENMITAADEIMMQLSVRFGPNHAQNLIANGNPNNDNANLKNTIFSVGNNTALANELVELCDLMQKVLDKHWNREQDDLGSGSNKLLATKSIFNKVLLLNNAGTAQNNSKFRDIFNNMLLGSNKVKFAEQSKNFCKNTEFASLNDELFEKLKSYHETDDATVKNNIKTEIKTLIRDKINDASKVSVPAGQSERRKICDYLKKLGITISIGGAAAGTDIGDLIGGTADAAIDLDKSVLMDKDGFKKIQKYRENEKKIAENTEEMKSLNNVPSL